MICRRRCGSLLAGRCPRATSVLFAQPGACPDNSFVRIGLAAHAGWRVAGLLAPFTPIVLSQREMDSLAGSNPSLYAELFGNRRRSPGQGAGLEGRPRGSCPGVLKESVRCELHVLRPSIALIMIGTSDVSSPATPVSDFAARLERVVAETSTAGTIPVLSTIPPREEKYSARVAALNAAISKLARSQELPLWNLWLGLRQRA
jgi:hypothetical protein